MLMQRIGRGRLWLATTVVAAGIMAAAYAQGQGPATNVATGMAAAALGAAETAAGTGGVPVRVSVDPLSVIAGNATYVRVYLNTSAMAGGQPVEMAFMTTEDDQDLLASYETTVSVDEGRYVKRFALQTVSREEGGYISVVARIGNTTTSTVLKVDGASN